MAKEHYFVKDFDKVHPNTLLIARLLGYVITFHHILINRCQLVQQSVLRYGLSSAHPSVTYAMYWKWLKSLLVSCHQRAVNRKYFLVNICTMYCACLMIGAYEVQR